MAESQNIEYKQSWRDEYLKWICGFANANGGTIFIGKDDGGKTVGVADAKKLLEDIPNKVRDVLGILVDVNLHETVEGDFLEIIVEPYPNAVNYKGQYHYRSGSTKQEMKGATLDKFLLQKKGVRWDGAAVPRVSVDDLKKETFVFFRQRGFKNKRLSEDSLIDRDEHLLENLKLIENGYLKRAAILLFHPDPEKYMTGAYVKIGYFEGETDLIFQDEVHGNLFEQVERTIDLLFTKYIKALISYDGIHRNETYEYPKEAVREALLNAIAHKDYSGLTPIQIRVYPDKLMIWNEGHLPENWTVSNLLKSHSSRPYNPDIANAFFRSGYVESWGRGISKMTEQCLAEGLPEPSYLVEGSDFWVVFKKDIYNTEYLESLGLNSRQVKAVLFTKNKGKITNSDYQKLAGVSRETSTRDIKELIDKKLFKSSGIKGAGAYYTLN
ncbi:MULTISPECIES: ATP-binding protein [Sphingobacterium]|uniref:Divergent AAA domain n=2 Tax=Sphingobacteriaceae TaxID=84566 RepID=A0A2X2LQK9_SPHMU|nr:MULTISPECIES: ATP-binding protein [Sphingobacterium]HAE68819.1 transcriptional regulator [Sphingobacterium sp.]OFV18382.1 transcriptional regulator [Sphingobacterium sp. HMSC13C05]QQT47472.1 putative DNA binding domain-containing protein [Sphingobacterium multivorum]QQT64393.1 putative DNA binding domain-containing protein [Sphingobacterium multivorum]QRQ60319.1 putative DNA binding domain-containing protein [Sphingobacterium multivorum]